MCDMLVKLYETEEAPEIYETLAEKGIRIHRALGMDAAAILGFVKEHFGQGWADECRVALAAQPSTCYIAVKEKQVIGFCCYDATCKGFAGPVGVDGEQRGQGIGQALMRKCLLSMREAGYGYAIIGWAAQKAIPMYERCFHAVVIPDSHPGVYAARVEAEN